MIKLTKQIENKVVKEVKEYLAEVDIEELVAEMVQPKKIREEVKRVLSDEIYRAVSQEYLTRIHIEVKKRLAGESEFIQGLVEQSIKENFGR